MKYFITALLALSFTTSSFANCIDAYELAADKRDSSNGFLVAAGVVATVATAVILADNNDNDRGRRDRVNPRSNSRGVRHNTRRGRRNHRRHRYGVYYIGHYNNDSRWLGDNSFDEVLMAYNDAAVSVFNDIPYGNGSMLSELERKVAKKLVKIAKKQGLAASVTDIKRSKRLTSEDKRVLRDSLIEGIESAGNQNFCPYGRAYKRTRVIKELAQAVLLSRS